MAEWLSQPVPIHVAVLGALVANAVGWGIAFWWQERSFKNHP